MFFFLVIPTLSAQRIPIGDYWLLYASGARLQESDKYKKGDDGALLPSALQATGSSPRFILTSIFDSLLKPKDPHSFFGPRTSGPDIPFNMKVTMLFIIFLPLLTTAIVVPQRLSLVDDDPSHVDDSVLMVAGNDYYPTSAMTNNHYNNYVDDNYKNYYDYPGLIDDNYNNPTLMTVQRRAVSVVARGTSPIFAFDFSAGDTLYCDAQIGRNRNTHDHRVVALPSARFPHLLDHSWCGRRITLTYRGLTSSAIIGDRCGPSCVRRNSFLIL